MSVPSDLDARLQRMERSLERITALLDHVSPTVAMAADIGDEWVHETLGDSTEDRLQAVQQAAVTLSEPATLEALTRIAALAPQLESLATLASGFDNHVAMAADMADEWVAEQGDVDERMQATLDAALTLSDPTLLASLLPLIRQTPAWSPIADALTDALAHPPTPTGAWGLFRALGEPQVQRGVGVLLNVARALGRTSRNPHT